MVIRLLFPILLFLLPLSLQSEVLFLTGHLDREAVAAAQDRYRSLAEGGDNPIQLQVNSASGDLQAVLDLAKQIYTDKRASGRTIEVYIEESAIGPAAVLPFLADRLGASLFVAWGDVTLGSEENVPSNVLRSRVRSLIAPKQPQAELLAEMAEAMADPDLSFSRGSLESEAGEALVVEYNQLEALRLLSSRVTSFEATPSTLGDDPTTSEVERSLTERLAQHIKFNESGSNKIGLIRIDDRDYGINKSTWIHVKAALDYYKENRPAFIILELNTPGGEVFSSQKISDALKEMDTTYGVPCVAFINNWAISAGAMLAYSCRYITIVKDASMGAAEPVFQGQEGQMQTASEKINSALRTDFANRAGFFDRDPLLAMAMVDKDMLLVRRHGKIVKLDDEDEIRRTGLDPDEVITVPGKLLTLSAEQMLDLDVVDARVLPARLEPITDAEKEQGEWPASKSLLFQLPFFASIPNATIDPVEMSWQLQFLAYLTVPAVASVLFLGMMMGGYMELNSPGFGLPGTVALVCLSLIILSSFAMEAASWLELILVLLGIVLLALEIFVIPGFGIAGILGIILFVGGIFAVMLPGLNEVTYDVPTDTLNAAGQEFMLRLTWLSGTLVLGIVLIGLLAKYVMPKMTLFNRLALVGHEQEGFTSVSEEVPLPKIGDRGEVVATLRPAGKVEINNQLYDVTSSGGFIERGTSVEVVALEGGHAVVREVEEV